METPMLEWMKANPGLPFILVALVILVVDNAQLNFFHYRRRKK